MKPARPIQLREDRGAAQSSINIDAGITLCKLCFRPAGQGRSQLHRQRHVKTELVEHMRIFPAVPMGDFRL